MPNVEKALPYVEIELGGKVRRLVCDLYALGQIERTSGQSAMTSEFFQHMGLDKLLTMTCFFLRKDPELASLAKVKGVEAVREQLSDWIPFERFSEVFAAVMQAFTLATNELRQAEGNAPTVSEAPNGTGSNS